MVPFLVFLLILLRVPSAIVLLTTVTFLLAVRFLTPFLGMCLLISRLFRLRVGHWGSCPIAVFWTPSWGGGGVD